MTIVLEGIILAAILSLSFFSRQGDFTLKCFQVDPQTETESPLGYIVLKRKKKLTRAYLLQWGPDRINRRGLAYLAIPNQRLFMQVAILPDEKPGAINRAIVLTRSNTLKKRFDLSESVRDRTRPDYCIKIRRGDLPTEAAAGLVSGSRDRDQS